MRNAEQYPVCTNTECRDYGRGGPDKVERTMKRDQQYLWVKEGRAPMFVSDLVTLYKNRDFDSAQDKIYEIGPEVKLEMTVKVIPAKPVTRFYDPTTKE